MNLKSARPVIITRPDGTEVEYPSQSAAGRAENMMQSPISEMCRGMKKTHNGYKARWKDATMTAPVDTASAAHAP